MKSTALVAALCLLSSTSLQGQAGTVNTGGSIESQQLKFPRVRKAKQDKDSVMRSLLEKHGLSYPPHAILLRAFKKEGQVELWGAGSDRGPYVLLKNYGICATSGILGPKRRFGDEQVPEGFYDLDWFNPQSNFLLSMHVSYPNAADRILGSKTNLGGDIFLHGNCASIGCIPITDDGIEEMYWLAVLVKSAGAKHLPIQIFPSRMNDMAFGELAKTHAGQFELLAFWKNLKVGFDLFEKDHRLREVHVAKDGRYEFVGETAAAGQR